jgi:hypothetical protein
MSPEELASDLHSLTILSIPDEYFQNESIENKLKLVSLLVEKSPQEYGNRRDIYLEGFNINNPQFTKLGQDILTLCKSLQLNVETRDKEIKCGFQNLHTAFMMNFDNSLNYTLRIDTVFEINDEIN